MRLGILSVSVLCAAVVLVSSAKPPEKPSAQSAGQAIVVTTHDWNTASGTLQRYERAAQGWRPVGEPFPVVIGRSGMGWGLGVFGQSTTSVRPEDPVKREGDGRSPAGVFPIGAAFGYADAKPTWLKLPYTPLTPATECVDDAKSDYYNAVVDRLPSVAPDWNSSEKMRQIDVYRWGVVVDQNAQRQRGGGSCIFLHIWKGPQSSTAGCTAMEQGRLEQLMAWLDPAAHPVLIALPEAEYRRLRGQWNLP